MQTLKLGGERLVVGAGAVSYLETICGKRAFIVTSGPLAKQLGQLNLVETALEKAGIISMCFDEVEPDPEIGSVLQGAAIMRDFAPDWIIALGGGSAMDSAKAMWVAYEHPEFDALEKFMPPNSIPPMRRKARLVCIPTTSGTGSEVTRSVVLSDKARGLKLPFRDESLIADIAILDAALTLSMPPSLTAHTGMDALTHAVEAYVSRSANDFSDALAEKSIVGIFQYLPQAVAQPDCIIAREKMHHFATIAGLSFANVGLGIVHSIAHAFGAVFHLPHGLANAITLPYVVECNRSSSAAEEKYRYLEKLLGAKDLGDEIQRLKQQVRIPRSMREVIGKDTLPEEQEQLLAEKALQDSCTLTNPVQVSLSEMKHIIRQVYSGNAET